MKAYAPARWADADNAHRRDDAIMNKSTIDGDGGPKKWEFRPADDEAGSSEETQATANDTGAKE